MKGRDFKFDKRANNYDTSFEGKLSQKFYGLIYQNVDLKVGDNVLDVGCGTGTILKGLSEIKDINGHGIDVEPNMLSVAKSKCPNMDIRNNSCDNTDYNNESFDVLTTCMAYHHFPDKEGFEKEAERILKPGGYLYIVEPNFPLLIRKTVNSLTKRFNGEFLSSDEIKKRFEKQGFTYIGTKIDCYAQLVIFKKNS